jgi:hypothetical protein
MATVAEKKKRETAPPTPPGHGRKNQKDYVNDIVKSGRSPMVEGGATDAGGGERDKPAVGEAGETG